MNKTNFKLKNNFNRLLIDENVCQLICLYNLLLEGFQSVKYENKENDQKERVTWLIELIEKLNWSLFFNSRQQKLFNF